MKLPLDFMFVLQTSGQCRKTAVLEHYTKLIWRYINNKKELYLKHKVQNKNENVQNPIRHRCLFVELCVLHLP